jgi:hypothetical protein
MLATVREEMWAAGEHEEECIRSFERLAAAKGDEWWAPVSSLPCSKHELLGALLNARERAYPDNIERVGELTALIGALTQFIPDADLDEIRPFLGTGGRITGRRQPDAHSNAARDRAYQLLAGHLEERKRLLPHTDQTAFGGRARIGEQRLALRVSAPPADAGLSLIVGAGLAMVQTWVDSVVTVFRRWFHPRS